MFIYKITVGPENLVYIGLDTKPSYKLSRWKIHCRNSKVPGTTKLSKAMNQFGVDQCSIEILEDNFSSIGELALAEINYINQFNSYKTGLNSSTGGDGLGRHTLSFLSELEIKLIREALGDSFRIYNNNIKWANTNSGDRKVLTRHLHTDDVYKKKSETLKKYYKANPCEKEKRKKGIIKWQQENKELMCENNQRNGLKGAKKVSKKLLVEMPNGDMLHYESKSDFGRKTNQWPNTIIRKTKEGLSHNGFRAWEQ